MRVNLILSGSLKCGGEETKTRGIITPPVHDERFDVSIECLWTISRGVIELTVNFTRFVFDPACSHGGLQVNRFNQNPLILYKINCTTGI